MILECPRSADESEEDRGARCLMGRSHKSIGKAPTAWTNTVNPSKLPVCQIDNDALAMLRQTDRGGDDMCMHESDSLIVISDELLVLEPRCTACQVWRWQILRAHLPEQCGYAMPLSCSAMPKSYMLMSTRWNS
jgi:hypothetical protein